MSRTVYIPVPVKERLPKEGINVLTEHCWMNYKNGKWYRRIDDEISMPPPTWWLEPQELPVSRYTEEQMKEYGKKSVDNFVDAHNSCGIIKFEMPPLPSPEGKERVNQEMLEALGFAYRLLKQNYDRISPKDCAFAKDRKKELDVIESAIASAEKQTK